MKANLILAALFLAFAIPAHAGLVGYWSLDGDTDAGTREEAIEHCERHCPDSQ